MATKRRTSIPVTISINGEEQEARIVYAMTGSPWQPVFALVPRDRRKKPDSGLPEITFRSKRDAFEFMGKAIAWIGKH